MGEQAKENVEQKLRLTRNAKILLIIGGLFAIANGLSGTFVNVYLWKAENDFVKIGIFNLSQYIFLPSAFVIGGRLVKGRNGTTSLRIGIMFHALFYLVILLLSSKAVKYTPILGGLLGTEVSRWKDPDLLRRFLWVIGSAQLWILLFRKRLDFDTGVMEEPEK